MGLLTFRHLAMFRQAQENIINTQLRFVFLNFPFVGAFRVSKPFRVSKTQFAMVAHCMLLYLPILPMTVVFDIPKLELVLTRNTPPFYYRLFKLCLTFK